jgi:16S rRNA (guanine966-N2)-methyltransferase
VSVVRVVAGSARGRLLRAPAGRRTRPTSDRVREAVFSMLSSMDAIEAAVVVDLFAGSGALGIEALSRGADRVTFVDDDPAASEVIGENLSVLGEVAERGSVVCGDALAFARDALPADLVFADPPYAFDRWSLLLEALSRVTGLLVAEAAGPVELADGWETVKVRSYGGTVVTIARPVPRLDGEDPKGAT